MRMVVPPANSSHFRRLMALADDVLAVCERLQISPMLSGSLAVLAYTQRPDIAVNDIDLACPERDFSRLSEAFSEQDIPSQITPWHVLQIRRDDMKVEFDSIEHWMHGLSGSYQLLDIGRFTVRVLELDDLRELYRRGVQSLERRTEDTSGAKLMHVRSRYELLRRE